MPKEKLTEETALEEGFVMKFKELQNIELQKIRQRLMQIIYSKELTDENRTKLMGAVILFDLR
jgi:hypothetical protein